MRTTVRYTTRPFLWATLRERGISQAALAAQTPNSQQWASKVERDRERTVTPAWAFAVAAFLDLPFDDLFDPVVVSLNASYRVIEGPKRAA